MTKKVKNKKGATKFGARELGKLIRACFKGDLAFVKRMLRLGVDPNALHENSGTRPLIAASAGGHVAIVKLLLDAGADPNLQGTWVDMPPNGTPLENAAQGGHIEIVKLLVERGADVNKAGDWPPLMTACSYGRAEVIRYLLSKGARWEPSYIMLAVRSGNVKALEEMVRVGADVNYKSKDGETPLHFAAVQRSPAMAEALIRLGAKVNIRCKRWKETPLHRAASRGRLEVVRVLLEAGADPTIKNFKGKTPEQWARAYGQIGVAALIRNWVKMYGKTKARGWGNAHGLRRKQ